MIQGRWGDGLFEGDSDLDAIGDIFDPATIKPLKKDVIRLRLKAWEQEQLDKKSGKGKSLSPVSVSMIVSIILLTDMTRRHQE